jgi:tRNA pseudouridine38-40 synthase
MVRIMVGTLLDMGAKRLPEDAIRNALASGDRSLAGATAPAKGLRLEKVFYGEER